MSKVHILVLLLITSLTASAQSGTTTKRPEKVCGPKHLDQCFVDLVHDQAGIWSSPFRVKARDAVWLVPFAAASGTAIYYDAVAQRKLGIDRSRIDASNNIARFGSPNATFAAGAGLYLLGALSKNEKLSETGRLGAEAVINAEIVSQALKLATNRERPVAGTGEGRFWPHGTTGYDTNSSFPSGHATSSWALARVIALEYPNTPTRIAAYSFATTMSVVRVTGRKHFPSDVIVGSTFGYLIGSYVYRHHSKDAMETSYLHVMPEFNQRTHTYGARLEFSPSALVHPGHAIREALR